MMSNKKQTSIEWLEWQINLGLSERGLISAFKEAKAMHKEEIIEAVYDSMGNNFDPNIGRAELYYKEKYENGYK